MKRLLCFSIGAFLAAECLAATQVPSVMPVPPVLEYKLPPAIPRAKLEANAKEILTLPDADVIAMVPVQTPFITSDCPNCGQGHYTRGLERNLFKLTPPNQLTCLKCQATFPSDKFRENDRETFLNTLGEKVEVGFYKDAEGKRFALSGALHSWQNGWLIERLIALGRLYQLTGDEQYARRAVLILDRYARVFPHYLVKDFLTDHLDENDAPKPGATQKARYVYVSTGGPWLRDGKPVGRKPNEPEASNQPTSLPYGWTQSRWGWGRWGGEFPGELLQVYDLVHGSPAFDELSLKLGVNVRQRILSDLFANAVAYLQEYPWYYQLNNNASSHIADIIRAGRALDQPEWVHFGYRWSHDVLEKYAFSRDAAFAESPGYFYVFLATQEGNFSALDGYSDPPGFRGTDGLHLENLGSTGSAAFLKKARATVESIRFPNGSSLPLGDNRHDEFVDPLYRPGTRGTPLTESRSVLLPGYGHAVLGAGTGDWQVQAHLQFSKFTGVVHTHHDGLSLMLWAFGAEFFTDVGYHKTKYRGFASTTLSHNTVVIDRKPQEGAEPKGNVLLYEPNLPGLSIIQVEQKGAYEGVATRYRRTLLLNNRHLGMPYVVDVFEVRGGRIHDYVLHGPTLYGSTAGSTLQLAPMAGERPLLAPGEKWGEDTVASAYGVFTNVRTAEARGDFSVTWSLVHPYELPEYHPNDRYKPGASLHYEVDPGFYRDHPELSVVTHIPAAAETKVFLADSPSLTRSGLGGSALTEKLKRPSLILRREGGDGLSSVFVAVHEPYSGAPRIRSVQRVLQTDSTVVLNIKSLQDTDTVVLNLDGAAPVAFAGFTTDARISIASYSDVDPPFAAMIGGTQLKVGALTLDTPAATYTGTIESVASRWDGALDNTFVTGRILPAGETLRGTWMSVSLGDGAAAEAFEIDHVAPGAHGSTIYLKDDPGVRANGKTTTEIFFPRRRFSGANTFTIYTRAVSQ